MIVLKITLHIIPEKQLEMMQTLQSMIEPTAKEAGCISHDVFYDIEDKCHFSLLQEWETREDLDRHIASHRFGVLLGTKALLCEPLEVQILTVSHLEGMDAIYAVRGKTNMSSTNEQRSFTK